MLVVVGILLVVVLDAMMFVAGVVEVDADDETMARGFEERECNGLCQFPVIASTIKPETKATTSALFQSGCCHQRRDGAPFEFMNDTPRSSRAIRRPSL
jgi:hypothetical protein